MTPQFIDEQVILRKHRNGDITIMDLHGQIIQRSNEALKEAPPDEGDFYRGLMWALLFSSAFWGTLLWLMTR